MKKSVKVLLSVILVLAILSTCVCLGVTFIGKKYVQAEDTAFKVLQITDVHILNDEKKDAKAMKTITEMVKTTSPDLIMVTGDITSEKENFTAFKTFGTFMESLGVPWGFVFGNHEGLDIKYEEGEVLDPEKIADRKQLSDYLTTLPNCIYEPGDENVDGYGNYIYNVKDENGKVITTLIMLDSHSGNPDESVGGYDFIHENQIEWYKNTIKSVAKEVNGDETKVVPSIAFFHIPMREYTTAYDQKGKDSKLISGMRLENECPSNVDDDLFEAMQEMGSTKGVFVGHDHMNNYEVEYKGIRLAYGLSCDHNIYIVPFRGGKLINIKKDGTFTTQDLIRHRGQSTITIGKEK